jgi:hypothetical protein
MRRGGRGNLQMMVAVITAWPFARVCSLAATSADDG